MMHLMHQGVAVFEGDAPTAIAFTRSLGSRGVPVTVYSSDSVTAASVSRYCTRTAPCPPLAQPDAFLPWLEGQFRDGSITCVAPTSDHVAFYLSELDSVLPPELRRAIASPLAVRSVLFKDRFHASLEVLGARAPVTAFPFTPWELERVGESMQFPLVLKPRSHVGVGLARGSVAADIEGLRTAFRQWPEDDTNETVFARYPELRFPMVQEYVPGALEHLYSVSGLIGPNGEVVAASGSRKTGQWPPGLGVGVGFVPWTDDAAVSMGVSLAATILRRGLFELELIWDPRQSAFLAIDLNPRAHGQVSLDIARGNDLPWLWYRLYLGENVAPAAPPRNDVTWRHSLPFHAGWMARTLQDGHRSETLGEWFKTWKEDAVDIVQRADDPMPGVVYSARMLRHPGGLLRPFLRS